MAEITPEERKRIEHENLDKLTDKKREALLRMTEYILNEALTKSGKGYIYCKEDLIEPDWTDKDLIEGLISLLSILGDTVHDMGDYKMKMN